MDLVNWTHLHLSRILTSAQRRRDALHRARRDAPDVTRGSSVNMAAENGDHSPGVLQCLPKPRHYLQRFEVEAIRPDHNLKRRVMAEDCDWLGPAGVDHINQMSDPLAAKAAFVAACAESIKCNQSHRIIVDRIFDKAGTRKKIPIR